MDELKRFKSELSKVCCYYCISLHIHDTCIVHVWLTQGGKGDNGDVEPSPVQDS